MSATRAIVFDLDDTLYPEQDFTFSGYRAVARAFAHRLAASPDVLVARMQAMFDTPDRGRVFNVLVAEAGAADAGAADAAALVAEMIAAFRAHRPAIRLHPDADAALKRHGGRCRLGLLSDGPLDMQRHKLAALGLPPRLDEVILTDQWGPAFWKPHPRGFEEIARRLGVSPADCLYVADNPAKDFVAPNALGWQTVFIKRPDGIYRDQAAPAGGAPGVTIDTLDALSPA